MIFWLYNYVLRFFGLKIGKKTRIIPSLDHIILFNFKRKKIFIGDNVTIGRNSWIFTIGNGELTIKDNVVIGRNAVIAAKEKITIEENILFSYNVSVIDHDHNFTDLEKTMNKNQIGNSSEIFIGKNSFVGCNSIFLKGSRINQNTIVGANSVVTKRFYQSCVVLGNPAKLKTLS